MSAQPICGLLRHSLYSARSKTALVHPVHKQILYPIKIFTWQKGRSGPIPVGNRNGRGRKAHDSRAKSGRSVRFGITLPSTIGAYHGRAVPRLIGRSRAWPQDLRTPKYTPNHSLVTHTKTYMRHTSAIERIFESVFNQGPCTQPRPF